MAAGRSSSTSLTGSRARSRNGGWSRRSATSARKSRLTAARVSAQAALPRARKSLSAGRAKTRCCRIRGPAKWPCASRTARSRTCSPMATPTRAGSPGRRKTPKGRFWIGKCESGGTGTKERRVGSLAGFMVASRSQEPQGLQVVARLVETTAAKRQHAVQAGVVDLGQFRLTEDDRPHQVAVFGLHAGRPPCQPLLVEEELRGVQ